MLTGKVGLVLVRDSGASSKQSGAGDGNQTRIKGLGIWKTACSCAQLSRPTGSNPGGPRTISTGSRLLESDYDHGILVRRRCFPNRCLPRSNLSANSFYLRDICCDFGTGKNLHFSRSNTTPVRLSTEALVFIKE